MKDQHAQSGTH